MDTSTKYELISVAYRSRFLFRSEGEFREAIGVSYETVVNNRESARDIDVYYNIIDRKTEDVAGMSLEEVMGDYLRASEFYLSLDWGDRSQLASRRKFCRMLFRLYATAGLSLTNDEIFKFRMKNDDRRLLGEFFPDGEGEAPAVNVALIVLFAFGVVRPFSEKFTVA